MSLFTIHAAMRAAAHRVETAATPEEAAEAMSDLECLDIARDDKIVGRVAITREWRAHAATAKEEAERLTARARAFAARADRLDDNTRDYMQAEGIGTLKHPYFTVSVQANPPSVRFSVNEAEWVDSAHGTERDGYLVCTPASWKPDRKAIAALLATNPDALPGVTLARTTRLAVR